MKIHEDVITLIANERIRQDARWGGPEHDDTHIERDWLLFVEQQTRQADVSVIKRDFTDYKDRLVKIAALAVAAIESFDRLLPYPWCADPARCAGLGTCPRDPNCGE